MRTSVRLVTVLLAFVLMAMTIPVSAKHHTGGNFFQRHKTLSTLGAGYAAYKISKHTGSNRMAAGGRKNFAQRHPFLTGAAAAGLTHHMLGRRQH